MVRSLLQNSKTADELFQSLEGPEADLEKKRGKRKAEKGQAHLLDERRYVWAAAEVSLDSALKKNELNKPVGCSCVRDTSQTHVETGKTLPHVIRGLLRGRLLRKRESSLSISRAVVRLSFAERTAT
jgi:hypothetical protein